MPARLKLLGQPALTDEDDRALAYPLNGLLLAAWLLLSQEGHVAARAQAAAFLWDTADPQRAAANLRMLLQRVRQAQARHGVSLLAEEGGALRLDTAAVRIDVLSFQQSVGDGRYHALEAIRGSYGGDFFAQATGFGRRAEHWIAVQRSRLRELFIAAIVPRLEDGGGAEPADAVRAAAYRLLEVDPYQEPAYRALMRILGSERQYAEVRRLFEQCRATLGRDLGEVPQADTLSLVRTLMTAARPATTPLPDERPAAGLPRLVLLPPALEAGAGPSADIAGALIEDVTIGLCGLRTVAIVAPHSAARIGARNAVEDVVARYGLDYVVESRVVDRSGHADLFVQLVKAQGRDIVWAERAALNADTAALRYRDLATRIAGSLVAAVERSELGRLAVVQHPSAYHHTLVGRQALVRTDLPSVRRARKSFRAALALAPDFVPALSGLARTYHLEWLVMAKGEQALLDKAVAFAGRAVASDPSDARGYREAGVCSLFQGRFDDSLEAFAEAETRSPQYADLLADFADTLVHASEPALGLAKIQQAIALNPLCADDYWWTAAGANYHLQRYDAAIESVRRMENPAPAYRLVAAAWAMLGDARQARLYRQRARQDYPDFRVSDWLSIVPIREAWQREHYEAGLRAAGFE